MCLKKPSVIQNGQTFASINSALTKSGKKQVVRHVFRNFITFLNNNSGIGDVENKLLRIFLGTKKVELPPPVVMLT